MDKQQIIDYLLKTPFNTNPNVISTMLDQYGGSEPETVTVTYTVSVPGTSHDQIMWYYTDGTATPKSIDVATGAGSINPQKNSCMIAEYYSEDGQQITGVEPLFTLYGEGGLGHEYAVIFCGADLTLSLSE